MFFFENYEKNAPHQKCNAFVTINTTDKLFTDLCCEGLAPCRKDLFFLKLCFVFWQNADEFEKVEKSSKMT